MGRAAKTALRHFVPHGSNNVFVSYLKYGDILLFRCVEGKRTFVTRYQELYGYPLEASRIGHVAVYIGNNSICHAVPTKILDPQSDGIILQRLWPTMSDSRFEICALRASGIKESDRMEIALAAAAYTALPNSYSYDQITQCVIAAARLKLGNPQTRAQFSDLLKRDLSVTRSTTLPQEINEDFIGEAVNTFLCSDFVLNCYSRILKSKNPLLAKQLLSPIYVPADLHDVAGFTKVHLPTEHI